MHFAEVVVSEVETDSRQEVFKLFAGGVREPGKPAQCILSVAISFSMLTNRKTTSILSQHIFSFYAKYFMKSKMGRPKVPKAKLRGIIVNARLSPEEHRKIEAAISKACESKSDWVRKALLACAEKCAT